MLEYMDHENPLIREDTYFYQRGPMHLLLFLFKKKTIINGKVIDKLLRPAIK